jgi:hypothetical protein
MVQVKVTKYFEMIVKFQFEKILNQGKNYLIARKKKDI